MVPQFLLVQARNFSVLEAGKYLAKDEAWHVVDSSVETEENLHLLLEQFRVVVIPEAFLRKSEAQRYHDTCRILCYGHVINMQRALILGALDYLVLPWHYTELIVRTAHISCRNSMRLYSHKQQDARDKHPDFTGFPRIRMVWELLYYYSGTVVSRHSLLKIIGRSGKSDSRAVDMLICRLRRMLKTSNVRIDTISNVGYMLVVDR